jgi:hypothetical protein
MKRTDVPKSPVFPQGKAWSTEGRPGLYESEISAMLRHMLEEESIKADQAVAWARWRTPDRDR